VPIKVADCPLNVLEPKVAEQEFAPTVQFKLVPAAQGAATTGTMQLELVAAPQLPSVQRALALPTVGAAVSEKLANWPDSVRPPVGKALQLPPVPVQLKLAEQERAGLQSIADTVDTPSLQVKLAVPVFGLVLSVSVRLAACARAAPLALQVLPLTVQLNAPAAHAEGCVQMALVAAPHAPLVQTALAVPVVGAMVSDSATLVPDAVAATAALHVLLPTVQVMVCAGQAVDGATIGLP
jgi:hypothetical protein